MHPSMAREIIRQREHDLQAQARRDGDAKAAREAARARCAATAAAEKAHKAALSAIPDYVDGTFSKAGSRTHADV